MKAITLIQPWSYAVAHLGKPVENRTWCPPRQVVGQRIAIHAGKKLDEDACVTVALRLMGQPQDLPDTFVHGAVEAVATLAGFVVVENGHARAFGRADVRLMNSAWWVGPVGWHLTDVVALPKPVPCRGAQGLWTLTDDVEADVREQMARVHG